MALNESSLTDAAVTDEHQLELWDLTVLLLIDHLIETNRVSNLIEIENGEGIACRLDGETMTCCGENLRLTEK
jgi:hypothetical protein